MAPPVHTSGTQESDICDPVIPPVPASFDHTAEIIRAMQAPEISDPLHPAPVLPEARGAQPLESEPSSGRVSTTPRAPFHDAPHTDFPSDNSSISLILEGPPRNSPLDLHMEDGSAPAEAGILWAPEENEDEDSGTEGGSRFVDSEKRSLKRLVRILENLSEDQALPSYSRSATVGPQVISGVDDFVLSYTIF